MDVAVPLKVPSVTEGRQAGGLGEQGGFYGFQTP